MSMEGIPVLPRHRLQKEETPSQTKREPDWSQFPTVENVVEQNPNPKVTTQIHSPCIISGKDVVHIRKGTVEGFATRTVTPGKSDRENRKEEIFI